MAGTNKNLTAAVENDITYWRNVLGRPLHLEKVHHSTNTARRISRILGVGGIRMKFKKATIKNFKRFSDLTVQGIPETARLLMLAGPNGCGKSSFFDALYTWHKVKSDKGYLWDGDYHVKAGSAFRDYWNDDVAVDFHDSVPQQQRKKLLYVRSAYRNDPEFQITTLNRQGDPLDQVPFQRMIDNDAAVSRNYQRLVSQGLEDLYGVGEEQTTFAQYREESIGDVREALTRLFPDLKLDNLGSPLEDGTFRFTKGKSEGFVFKNLSGGEKAAFDLILDIVVARRDYDNTMFCIDEPESHMHAHLQAELLSMLNQLIPENCQLMLATHSIGMMRRAQDIESKNPGSVVFLDFGGLNFDESQVIEPAITNRTFWRKAYNIALDDVAELVAPKRVVICEGEPITSSARRNQSLDADCYTSIFGEEFSDTEFVSMGNDQQVLDDNRGLAEALYKLIPSIDVVRLIDRDDRSEGEVEEARTQGVRVLSRRSLESYLFDDEVLEALTMAEGKKEKVQELLQAKETILASMAGHPSDDLKPTRGKIYEASMNILGLTQRGNNAQAFMRDTLAPLIKPGMIVYKELKSDIFGP